MRIPELDMSTRAVLPKTQDLTVMIGKPLMHCHLEDCRDLDGD